MLGEAADLRMSEEQSPNDVAQPPFDRHGQVTADRKVSGRLSVIWRIVAITRIFPDIRAADDSRALEGRLEDRSIARHRELRKCFSRDSGDRVERVRLASIIHDVVEKGPELGRRQ